MLKTVARVVTFIAAIFVGTIGYAQNDAPNPYETIEGWAKLPEGRTWGATSAVYPANDGKHIWVADRCGIEPSLPAKRHTTTVYVKVTPRRAGGVAQTIVGTGHR